MSGGLETPGSGFVLGSGSVLLSGGSKDGVVGGADGVCVFSPEPLLLGGVVVLLLLLLVLFELELLLLDVDGEPEPHEELPR